jgi:hypothetical protein
LNAASHAAICQHARVRWGRRSIRTFAAVHNAASVGCHPFVKGGTSVCDASHLDHHRARRNDNDWQPEGDDLPNFKSSAEPGPNGLLLVFALTFLIIMLFQPLLKKYGPQPPLPVGSLSVPNPPTADRAIAVAAGMATASGLDFERAGAARLPPNRPRRIETVIENDLYRIVFTNRGSRSNPGSEKCKKTSPTAIAGAVNGGGGVWLPAVPVALRQVTQPGRSALYVQPAPVPDSG